MPYTGRSCWFRPAAWHKQQLCFLAVLLFGHSCSVWWSARVFLFGWQWCLEYCRQAVHWFSSTISRRTTGWTMWQDITFRTCHPGPHVSLWGIAGDWQSCPCTVPRLSALTQADYTIPVIPPAWFSFFWGNDQSLSENSAGIKKTSHQFTLVLSSREVLNSPLELSSTCFLFSQDSPVVDKSFTEISRPQVGGSTTRHGAEVFPWPRSRDTPTAVYLLLPGLDGSCPQSVHTRTDWPRDHW